MILKLLAFCFVLSVSPQESLKKTREIQGVFESIYSDNIQYIYAVNDQNNLIKLDFKGDTLYTFEDKSFPVYHVDPLNALKVLIYDTRQNIAAFLDKTLAPINNPIRFDDLGIPITTAVCSSRDNRFWVFDENKQELKKYDQNSQEVSNSGNMTLVTGKNIQPIFLKEENSRVYLLDSVQGVFQFDHLGTFLFNFKKIQAQKIVVRGDKIIFLKNKELYLYDMILLEMSKVTLPKAVLVKDFTISKQNLFVLTEQNIQIYRSALE